MPVLIRFSVSSSAGGIEDRAWSDTMTMYQSAGSELILLDGPLPVELRMMRSWFCCFPPFSGSLFPPCYHQYGKGHATVWLVAKYSQIDNQKSDLYKGFRFHYNQKNRIAEVSVATRKWVTISPHQGELSQDIHNRCSFSRVESGVL